MHNPRAAVSRFRSAPVLSGSGSHFEAGVSPTTDKRHNLCIQLKFNIFHCQFRPSVSWVRHCPFLPPTQSSSHPLLILILVFIPCTLQVHIFNVESGFSDTIDVADMSGGPPDVGVIIGLFAEQAVVRYSTAAATSLYVYDILLTFEDEVSQ